MGAAAEKATENTQLIPLENVNAVELFTGEGLPELLDRIEQEVRSMVPDTSTASGRQAIKSTAYAVTRSKTTIDNAGKELVADWKKRAAAVDAGRRHAREFLSKLAADVRQPLTAWEEEQARLEAEQKLRAEIEAAHDEALELDALWEREQDIARREAEAERKEAERIERERLEREEAERKAEAERREREAKEREERIARESEERAKREAEEALRREREARERAELEAKEAAERAQKEAKEAAERAEQERIEAEARAKRQAEEAAERERQRAAAEAEERERKRQAEAERKRQEEEARRADKENRERVNAAIIEAFTSEGVGKQTAEKIIKLVAAGSIPAMTIHY